MKGRRRRKRSRTGLDPRPGQRFQTSLHASPHQKVYGAGEKSRVPRYSHLCSCLFVQQTFVKLGLCQALGWALGSEMNQTQCPLPGGLPVCWRRQTWKQTMKDMNETL